MATIDEFLVSIGYETRGSEVAAFEESLKKVFAWAMKLGAALIAAEKAIQAVVIKTTLSLDQANFAASRTGTSVDRLQSLAYALQQVGMGANRAEALIGGLAQQLRKFPGTEEVLRRMGVRTRDGGGMRDTADIFRDAIAALNAEADYVIASTNAETLGISEEDYSVLRASAGKMDRFQSEFDAMQRAFGVDRNAAGKSSAVLAAAWRSSLMTIDAMLGRFAMAVAPMLSPVLDDIQRWMERNQDKIVAVCLAFVVAATDLGRMLLDLMKALAPVGDALLNFADATGEHGFTFAAEAIAGVWLIGIAARMLGPVGLIIAAVAGIAAMLMVRPAQAGASALGPSPAAEPKSGSEVGGGQKRSLWQRTKEWFGGRSDSGASGSYGSGGASGSWGGRGGARGAGGAGQPFVAKGGTGSKPALEDDRAKFSEELKDPAVAARLAAYTEAEVGSQGPAAQQAFIESIMNRASARNQTLRQTLSGSYFPAVTHMRAMQFMNNPKLMAKYGAIISAVLGGSNISGLATGNASGSVGFGGGPLTVIIGGEKYGVERADIAWVMMMQALISASRGVFSPYGVRAFFVPSTKPIPGEVTVGPTPSEPENIGVIRSPDEKITLGTHVNGDTGGVSIGQATEITVHGDPDPAKTAGEVSAIQLRVNQGMIEKAAP